MFRSTAILFGLSVIAASLYASPGAVYTQTNAASGNAVVRYARSADGALSAPAMFPTGGLGTGSGLGSQGAVALDESAHWLIAVNAGSNDVSVFRADNDLLSLTDRQPSGGALPISVDIDRGFVFVLNSGTPNISGFRLTPHGKLVALPGATRPLTGQAPAEVSFAAHGEALVVTEKASNTIEVFHFDDGELSPPVSHPASGATPFGFAIAKSDLLVVSEAAGGAPNASTVSSYQVDDDGHLQPVTSALPLGQTAACWVAVTGNGKFAYVANTGSSSISSLAIDRGGALTLLNAVAGQTPPGTAATDLAFSDNSRYLYGLAAGTISVFRTSPDGALDHLQLINGLPASTVGLVAH